MAGEELKSGAKFEMGTLVGTPNALKAVTQVELFKMVWRHLHGDWGEVEDEDRLMNEQALKTEGRIMSVYTAESGEKVWVITEADRSATTLLLPEDY